MDNLFEQIANISKAGAYEVVAQHRNELMEENTKLKARVKYLEDLINEYTLKMSVNLSGGKVDQFLKEQTQPENDIPDSTFTSTKEETN